MLRLKSTRLNQPQGRAEIDWSNPMTMGLAFLISMSGAGAVDVVNASTGSLTSASIAPQRNGQNLILNGSSGYAQFATKDAYNITNELTLVWVGTVTDYANYNMLVTRSLSNGATNNPFELRIDSSTGKICLTRSNVYGNAAWTSTTAVPVGVPVVVVATHPGTLSSDPAFYINGRNAGVNVVITQSGNATANAEPLYIGRRVDGYYHKGNTTFLAGLTRQLSAAEVATISANPWQLFR